MREKSERPKTPGPGQYQLKPTIGNDGPKITISNYRPLSSMPSSRLMIPGPGQYNSNLNDRQKSPSYKIGSSKRNDNSKYLEYIPGPGQYSPANKTVSNRPKSPTWSMGTSMRKLINFTEYVPGPGNYEVKPAVGEGPKVKKYKK